LDKNGLIERNINSLKKLCTLAAQALPEGVSLDQVDLWVVIGCCVKGDVVFARLGHGDVLILEDDVLII